MRVINCTPHELNVLTDTTVVTIEPSGIVPRVESHSEIVGRVDGIDLYRTTFGEVDGLPDPQPDTLLVVSSVVKAAASSRGDLVSPTRLVRDEHGRVTGCTGLTY